MGENPAEELAGAREGIGKLIEELEAEHHLAGGVDREKRLGDRLEEHVPGRCRVGVEVEVGHRRDGAGGRGRPTTDDDSGDDLGEPWITPEDAGDVCQRPQRQDRDLAGMSAERLHDHLLRGMLAMELDARQVEATEAVGAVEVPWVVDRRDVGRRRAETGELRGVEERDERLDVRRRLLGRDAPAGGRHCQDVESRIEQRDRQRDGVIDARIDVQDQLARQGMSSRQGAAGENLV